MVSTKLCYWLNLLIFLQIISVSFGYVEQRQFNGNDSQLQADDISNNVESQPEKNQFIQWISSLLTQATTARPTLVVPAVDCKPCTCGQVKKKIRIVGGQETLVNNYSWMAMLLYSNRFYCGGSVIAPKYVLTASHCVSGFNKDRITVRLLEHDRSSTTESETITRKIAEIIKHSSYDPSNYNNDIALLKLDSDVEFSDILQPVCLPTPGKSFTGNLGTVTGWGATMENGDISVNLQEVNVPIISNIDCRMTGYGATRITDNMLCAGYPDGKKDSCQGDSGGPLHIIDPETQRYQIAGIVSWGEGCAKPNYPGVYTRVNRYGTWIRSNTRDSCLCS